MKTTLLLAAASLAVAASPAAAQSVDDNTFTGLWGGVIAGYDVSTAGSEVDDDGADLEDQSIDGFGYGVQLGYDIDVGGVVLGAEAELAESTATVDYSDPDFQGIGLGTVDASRDLYLGARLGYKVAPDAMVYVKGGYTNAKYDILASDGTTDFENDFDLDGYRIGAGAEYAINRNSFVKLEYRYSNYSEGEIDFDGDNLDDSNRFDVDLDRHQIMAGVGFRF
ncbi:outer membrane protein [Qipengyuania sp.]|uniref:outer membrane protein n=1 Tax=Qipengyuania sp. TaxID=2004515 RepID=UPI0035C7FD7D